MKQLFPVIKDTLTEETKIDSHSQMADLVWFLDENSVVIEGVPQAFLELDYHPTGCSVIPLS